MSRRAAMMAPVGQTYAPGQNGTPTIRVGDTIAEVNYGTTEVPESISFPSHVEAGVWVWAVVQTARADRSEWMLGINGWVPDVFPTMEAAVHAATTPAIRRQVLERKRWATQRWELERKLREHVAAVPAAPEGATGGGDVIWT